MHSGYSAKRETCPSWKTRSIFQAVLQNPHPAAGLKLLNPQLSCMSQCSQEALQLFSSENPSWMRRWEVPNSPGKVLFDLPTKSFLNKKTLGLSPKTFHFTAVRNMWLWNLETLKHKCAVQWNLRNFGNMKNTQECWKVGTLKAEKSCNPL